MSQPRLTDEAVVEQARRALASRKKVRWWALINAACFLGLCGYFTFVGIHKIENLEAEDLNRGFLFGLGLAVVWTSFGIIGALFLAKALTPLIDVRIRELLIRYHDRLRDLGQLPDDRSGEPNGAADGSQPIRSETNSTSSAASSRR